jgi:hypothetical protein
VNRLVQWDPFQIRVNADAVSAAIRDRMKGANNLTLNFSDGAIDVAAGPLHARVTLAATAQREVRLSIFVNPGEPAIGITIALDSLLPPFVDLVVTSAEIRKDGLIISLGPGGADPPSK